MKDDLINTTVRLKDDAAWAETSTATGWPQIYGTVVDQTETKARVKWPTSGLQWVEKRDLHVIG